MDSLGAMIDSAVCQGREVDPYLPVWHTCYIARNALAVLVITSLELFSCNFFRYYFSKKKKEHPGDGWPGPPWSTLPWLRVERSNFFRYGIAMSLQCWSNQPWFLTATFSGITSLQKSITFHNSPTSTWWTAWAPWPTVPCVRVQSRPASSGVAEWDILCVRLWYTQHVRQSPCWISVSYTCLESPKT